jgi:DNA polymerase-3 subunit gamma/tau
VRALKEWTGQPWLVAAEGGGGAESLLERQKREDREELDAIKADPFVASVLDAFPGAEIVEVRKMPTPEAPPIEPDEEDEAEARPKPRPGPTGIGLQRFGSNLEFER